MIGSWRKKKVESSDAIPRRTTRDLFLATGKFYCGKKCFELMFAFWSFLVKDIGDLKSDLPPTCTVTFPNPKELYNIDLVIVPTSESMWAGGRFRFAITVPEDYKYAVRLDCFGWVCVQFLILFPLFTATKGALFDTSLPSQHQWNGRDMFEPVALQYGRDWLAANAIAEGGYLWTA